MTQAELDLIAKKMRARGLHASWEELLAFSEDLVGSLVNAYQVLLRSLAKSDKISSADSDGGQKVVKDKLAAVLTLLTSETQVAGWESEAVTGNSILDTRKVSHSEFEVN